MAVSTLVLQGEDKYARQAYQRRKDEIYFYNMNMNRLGKAEMEVERLQGVESEKQRLDLEVQRLRQQLAELQANK